MTKQIWQRILGGLALLGGFVWLTQDSGKKVTPQPIKPSPPTKAGQLHIIGDSQACRAGGIYPAAGVFANTTTAAGAVNCKISSRIADWNAHIAAVPMNAGDRVLIFLGSNEMNSAPDPTTIVNSIKSRGAIPVWVGPPLINGTSGQFIPHVQSVLSSLNVPYFDSRTLNLVQPDGIHPTAAEAKRWLNAVLTSQGWSNV